ncbi:hypothetical protein [Helicobacter sp. 23-1045]
MANFRHCEKSRVRATSWQSIFFNLMDCFGTSCLAMTKFEVDSANFGEFHIRFCVFCLIRRILPQIAESTFLKKGQKWNYLIFLGFSRRRRGLRLLR